MGNNLTDDILYSPTSSSSSTSQASSPTSGLVDRLNESRLSGRDGKSRQGQGNGQEKQLRSFPEQIVQLISAYEM